MEEFIFFAVIIFFSIIESIARARKQKKGGGAPAESLPDLPEPAEWETELPDFELPTYDADPSYDDRSVGRRTSPGAATQPGSDRPSSEELLPGQLLEELARLAGRAQEQKARTLDVPKESPPLPAPVPTRAPRPAHVPRSPRPVVQRRVPDRTTSHGPHRVHLAHAGYGTDPSSRAKSLQDDLDPLAERLGEDARAVRAQLRSRDTHALRRAFILGQVLDTPIGLRE